MKFKINESKIAGTPDPSGWVICDDFLPISADLATSKGHLYTIVRMQAKEGTTLPIGEDSVVGKEVLLRLEDLYFNKNGNPFDLLGGAIKNVHEIFTSPNEELHILSIAIIDNKIIFAGFGDVEAKIIRGSNTAIIIKKNTFAAAAGTLLDKDEIIISSGKGSITLKMESEKEAVPGVENIQKVLPRATESSPKKISKIRIIAAGLIDQILRFLPEKKSYVREEFRNPVSLSNKKKVTTTVGIILLVLLVISIVLGMKQKKLSDAKAQYGPILNSISHNLDEAENLSQVDAANARSLVLTAKSQLDDLISKKVKDPIIQTLSNRIGEDLGKLGFYQQNPNSFLDLTLLNNEFYGDDIAASDERMVVLDRKGKRLETIDIGSSKADPVAGPDIMPSANAVAAYSDRNFVTSDDGVWEIGDQARNVIKKDWGNNILIAAYTGNIYLLDKDNKAVWRFNGESGQFQTKAAWFAIGISPNLTNVISWTIDGNIWMLTKDGSVLRFNGGSPVDFMIKGMDKDMGAVDIFTTQDSKYLYFLDKLNSRVVVIDKEGNYKAQYIGDSIKNATKLIVSETDKKIILLEGTRLFSLDIKHL